MADLTISVEIDASKAKSGGGEVKRVVKSLASDTDSLTKNFLAADLASRGIANLSNLISQLGQDAIRTSLAVGQAVANVSTIKDIDISQVSDELYRLSTEIPQEAEKLGEGLYEIFSSVEASQQQALNLVELYAKGAVAARTETAVFGGAVSGVLNAYKLDLSEATHVSDVFFNTVKLGVVNGRELASNLGDTTQAAKNLGVNFDTLGGLIAGVTKEGGNASQNINNLSNLLQKLPVKETTDELDKMNVKWKDSNGNFRPVLDVLTDLKTKLDSMPPALRAAKIQEIFPDAQARTGLQTILSQLDFVKKAALENASAAGTTEEAYKKMSQTASAQLSLLYNSVVVFLVKLSEWVTQSQTLGAVLSGLSGVFQILAQNTGAVLALVAALGLLIIAYNAVSIAAGLSGATQGMSAFASSLGGTIFVIQNVIRAMFGLQTAFITTAETAVAATGGWLALVAVFGAIIYAIYKYNQAQQKTAEEHISGINAIQEQISALNEQKQTLDSLQGNVGNLTDKQQKLSDIYNVLDANSKNRIDAATAEKGAIGALADEVERLSKAKKVEADARLTELASKTFESFRKQQKAIEDATKAEQNYLSAKNNGLQDYFFQGEIAGGISVEQQFEDLRKAQINTSVASETAKKEFDGLKSALQSGSVILGTTAADFIKNKEATRELNQTSDEFRQSLSVVAETQGTVKTATNETTSAINVQTEAAKKLLDTNLKLALSYAEQGNRIKSAILGARVDFTDEQKIQSKLLAAKAEKGYIQQQIALQKGYFIDQFNLNKDSAEKVAEIVADKNLTLSKLNTDLKVNEINTQKEIAQIERDILDKRRQANIEFKNLQIREITTSRDFQIRIAGENFSELIKLTNDAYIQISRLTREQFDLQLQNELLTTEQRINLEKEKYLQLQDLASQNSEAISQIEDKQHNRSVELLKQESEQMSRVYQSRAAMFANLQSSFFQNNLNFGEGFKKFGLGILDTDREIKTLEKINDVLSGRTSIYQVQKDLLNKQHLLEETNLKREIDLNQDLITLERIRLKEVLRTNKNVLETRAQNLLVRRQNVLGSTDENKDSIAQDLGSQVQAIQTQVTAIDNLLNGTESNLNNYLDSQSGAIKRYKNGIEDTTKAIENLKISQAGEQQSLWEKSTEGLKTLYETISSGQTDTLIKQLEENTLWSEKVNLIAKVKGLENSYYKDSQLWALRRKEALLNYDKELFEAEQNSIIQIDLLRKQLANKTIFSANQADAQVLAHINSQIKSVTESVSGFKIAMADGFFKVIDSPFDALQKRLEGLPPIIKDVASAFLDLARDIIKAFSQKLILKLFGLDSGGVGGGGSNSGGGFNIGNILNTIFGGGGSGNRVGATPNFNGNNSTTGGGSNWIQQALGITRNFNTGGASATGNAHESAHAIGGGNGRLAGGLGIAGMGLNILGGLIGDRGGGILSSVGSGMSLGATIGSVIPGLGTAIGAGIGAIGGLIAGLLGGDPKRKVDAKENMPALRKGFAESLSQLKALATDKNALFSDPDGTLAKAMEIRSQIAGAFNLKFQSKKYRGIAQTQIAQKLAEAKAIIKTIREQSDVARTALDIDTRLETSFATGVYLRNDQMHDMQKQLDFKRRNGMLSGAWTGKDTLPSMLAKGEMVLNPMQIQRVILNAGTDPFRNADIPGYAGGKYVQPALSVTTSAPTNNNSVSPAASNTKQPVIVKLYVQNNGITEFEIKDVLVDSLGDSDVQVELVESYDKGKSRRRK